jgi:solute carrier family 10 (sodium/bile acid cotransporter), member 7
MRSSLRQHWFLLALAAATTGTLLWTEPICSLVSQLPPKLAVTLVLGFNAWTLESSRLWQSLRRPWYALLALTVTYGLLPALGWAASRWLTTPDFAVGVLIATSVPCTLAAATVWTRMAGGNEATALLVTLASTCTSWLVTTAWLSFTTGQDVELDRWTLMQDLAIYLIIPVSVGQLARLPARLRDFATRHRTELSVVSQCLILIIIMQAVADAAGRLRDGSRLHDWLDFATVALICTGIHAVGLVAGFCAATGLRFPKPERVAIAIAGSQKTLPIGLLIIRTSFPTFPLSVVPMLSYHILQLVVDSFVATWMKGKPQEHLADAEGLP